MKPQKFNKITFPEQGIPDGFFEKQSEDILRKTSAIENWSLTNSKNMESAFPIPNGYWARLENEIQNQIHPSAKRNWIKVFQPVQTWALASITLVCIGFGSMVLWKQQTELPQQNWNAQMEKIPQSELLAYLSETQGIENETTNAMAIEILNTKQLPTVISTLNDQEIERSFENLSTTDLEIDTYYE